MFPVELAFNLYHYDADEQYSMIIPSDTNSTRVLQPVILSVLEQNADKRDGSMDVDPMNLKQALRWRQMTKSGVFLVPFKA